MKKKLLWSLAVIVLLVAGYAIRYGWQYASIGSSYAAKITCSAHFISGRTLEDIKSHDLYAVKQFNVLIDESQKSVTADVYGLVTSTAVFREGLGCALANDISVAELKQQHLAYQRTIQEHNFPTADLAEYFDVGKFNAVANNQFNGPDAALLQTRALIIVKDGQLVYERYAEGFQRDTPLLGWSMTKSVTNAMLGILVKDNKLALNAPLPVDEWQKDERKNITLNDLLHMSSGLGFEENYNAVADATLMLFRRKSAGNYALQKPLAHKIGEVFSYSSGTTNILQEIMRRQFATLDDYQAFPYHRLFDKLGMRTAILEPDASGTFVGSSFMYASALDWARFGQLYLQKGAWNGEQLLPENWTDYSSKVIPQSNGRYAAHFWVDQAYPNFPQDAYYADGYEGQFVTIIPSQHLVIVRLACTHGRSFNNAEFVVSILNSQIQHKE